MPNGSFNPNNITLKQVRAFVAVARSRSFAEAAAQIHLSQPALSIAIKTLEDTLGGKLLSRTTRTFALTPEGESFYPTAQRLLLEWDHALVDLGNRFALKTGRITLAAMPSFAANLMPQALFRFRQQHPNIRVALHDVIAEEVVRMVRTGRAEIGISFDPGQQEDLLFTPLFEDAFVVVLPVGHPLEPKAEVDIQALGEWDLITLQAPSQVRELIATTLQQNQLRFSPALEAHQLVTIGRMVAKGMGISLVPALCQQQMCELGAICRPLKNNVLRRQVGVLSRRRYPLSAASDALLDILVETFADLETQASD
ncbi:LysR family transcriptional regulator [Pseudomaricurvus alkylphenolicus]|uniref:LysR family transcriptional regulator n=1 Tax=Pseudomaricurvus alkylphenolicus TaxID=1306991 RepID=UPI001420C721|nr:LysR family transcriptional regulator [Pseudomaricurvus alkylphenolicus]NIB39274.1 LysR family transcriptional regulator [Pseudomaricurvus alkylphenolicus]